MKRIAFTLVELLIVIVILGMLLGLTASAVQAARESGRSNTCRSNLHNLTLAAIQYDQRQNHYAGFFEQASNSAKTAAYWRPTAYLLFPFLDRNDLNELYSRDNYAADSLPGNAQLIGQFVCPSDPKTAGMPCAYVWNQNNWTPDEINYQSGENWYGLLWNNAAGVDLNNRSSYVFRNDGGSSTLLVSENLSATSYADADHWGRGFHWGDYSPASQAASFKINAANKTSGYQGRFSSRPSSNHVNAVNVGFCDGRVRLLRDNVSYSVYAKLCAPNDRMQGTVPNGFDYANAWQASFNDEP
jgi:prepilin-type N-terminal cleavage/methylation domain-containing protein/prepilin-type processing-associated H-X9-DG protein